jgi:hypothetical protein
MYVNGAAGAIYVSYWPAAHNRKDAWNSQAKVHFINGDLVADGQADWTSKPLVNLDEAAIIRWWSRVQPDPLIDYKRKKAFQMPSGSGATEATAGNTYNILKCQCSTSIVDGLWHGADATLKIRINAWKHQQPMRVGLETGAKYGVLAGLGAYGVGLLTVTPNQVRRLVEDVF